MSNWLHDLITLFSQPLFMLGDAQLTLARISVVLLGAGGAWFLTRGLERGLMQLSRRRAHHNLSESTAYALSRIFKYAIWTAVVLAALDYLGINLSSFALVGGAIGVGIGFGLQNIFSNFISGLVLLAEQTLKVGDFVDLQSGVMGRVAEIGIRYTRVTTNDAVDVIVPNSEFINGRVTNWTFGERKRRIHVRFGVAYGSDKERVREAALAAARSVEGLIIDQKHAAEVWLVNFGDSSLDFELVVWAGHALMMTPARAQALCLWALETELTRHHIEIPFPQRDLHIRSGVLKVEPSAPVAARASSASSVPST